jgi:acetyltransferase-like isoleucine patch superfamily enzyme
MIAGTARIYPGVILADDVVVEDYCIIGVPPVGGQPAETVIGTGSVIRSFTVIYAGNRIGRRFQTGNKANIREENVIGDDVSIGTMAVVEHHVTIGNGVRIHSQAFVPEYTVLEDAAWIGPNAVLTNARFPRSPDVKSDLRGPTLGSGSMVGANATVLPGVVIGRGSLVGAGSVVTRDVAEGLIVAGNPARRIRAIHY